MNQQRKIVKCVLCDDIDTIVWYAFMCVIMCYRVCVHACVVWCKMFKYKMSRLVFFLSFAWGGLQIELLIRIFVIIHAWTFIDLEYTVLSLFTFLIFLMINWVSEFSSRRIGSKYLFFPRRKCISKILFSRDRKGAPKIHRVDLEYIMHNFIPVTSR